MTGGAARLEDRGVKHSNLETGAPDDLPVSQGAHQPVARPMIEDMRVRNFALATQRDYIRGVKRLAAYLGRSPDTATAEELRAFQRHLATAALNPASINSTVSALRFFFRVTVDKPETTRHLVYNYEPQKLPRVLSPEEIRQLLDAATEPKDKAMLSVA